MFPRFAKNLMSPALGRSFRRFQSSVPLSKLRPSSFIAKAAAGGAIFGVVLSGLDHKSQSEARKKLQRTSDPASVSSPGWSLTNNEPVPRPDLPTFTLEEVEKHFDPDTSIWVTYRGAVYDVTKFMGHPGGWNRIMMAGGKDLEPFWRVYRLHYRGHVVGLLEKYRIGNLSPEDAVKAAQWGEHSGGFEDDPPRHPVQVGNTHAPFCGECRTDLMTESYFTPNEAFYTRNHNNVPNIDPEDWELTVEGEGVRTTTFTLKQLKELFPRYEVVSTIQCAGNRMEDYHGIGKGESKATFMSPHWACGAISNGKWAGARMRDILAYCGMDVDALALGKEINPDYHHVEFEAFDADETGAQYHASCPFDKVVDPWGDCLVAYEMNDRELPRDHGFPARAIVPGHAGARQPKWLGKITVKKDAFRVFQCTQFGPDVTFERDLANWPPKNPKIYENSGLDRVNGGQTTTNNPNRPSQDNVVREMPVQSLVTYPPQNAVIGCKDGINTVKIKGVAWSGGGMGIKRVDVSLNEGKHFEAAALYKPVVQHPRGQWGWTQFEHDLVVPEEAKAALAKGKKAELTIVSKALDSHWNVQPENAEPNINPRGVAINHWYRVSVTLDPSLQTSGPTNPQAEATNNERFANTPSGGKFRVPFAEAGWDNESGVQGSSKESWKDWHKVSNSENVKGQPGIKNEIDWEHYRNIKAAPYWQKPSKQPSA